MENHQDRVEENKSRESSQSTNSQMISIHQMEMSTKTTQTVLQSTQITQRLPQRNSAKICQNKKISSEQN